jgi:GNAT superfamily N-acetyltransferase
MTPPRGHQVVDDAVSRADDEALVSLLWHAYVDGGFTDAEVARTVLTPEAVRARGRLLWARTADGTIVGTIVLVPPDSSARRLAGPREAELHLLAVDTAHRGTGIGHALVAAAVDAAERSGYRRLVLWTQPAMHAARRVYERSGFSRSVTEDFERGGRRFHVYRRAPS